MTLNDNRVRLRYIHNLDGNDTGVTIRLDPEYYELRRLERFIIAMEILFIFLLIAREVKR